jgi:hypothetical protein
MTVEFGELRRLGIRTVWSSESSDFTPWLAANLDHLSEKIGLDLELVATEVAVGPFRVDLVAQIAGTDDLVVIENQFGPTDHDHLGKLLTYAAGQEAAYAVWIAERFRPEHRSAMEWVNHNSVEGVGFFGLQIEALQIDKSPIAVQLSTVVEPDQWAKQVTQATSTVSARRQLYAAFWEPLIDQIKTVYPGWSSKTVPPKDSWMPMPSGRTHPFYSIVFTGDRRLRLELYVDGPNEQAQQHLWGQLVNVRDQIDDVLPGLEWDAIPNKRASRISLYSPLVDVSVEKDDEWDTYRDWIIASLGPFRDAFEPHIEQLTPYVPPIPTSEGPEDAADSA